MSADKLEELRKPFPEGVVGVLPKPYKRDSQKGNCNVCGGYHGLPAAHLDFVGHAAVTDRLLSVDPSWTWEPMALDERGSPALDKDGNLWIRLTVCGVTRIGVGDGQHMKERIGDALRNAAMRFGVALSLWTKDELESGAAESKAADGHPDAQRAAEPHELPKPSLSPDGMVDPGTAKNRLLAAHGGDVKAMNAAWGSRGQAMISEDELAQLEAAAK